LLWHVPVPVKIGVVEQAPFGPDPPVETSPSFAMPVVFLEWLAVVNSAGCGSGTGA
jgi:hypothetical protein